MILHAQHEIAVKNLPSEKSTILNLIFKKKIMLKQMVFKSHNIHEIIHYIDKNNG